MMKQRTRGVAPSPSEQILARSARIKTEEPNETSPAPRLFLPTGCTLQNLAYSGRIDGGWPTGRICNPIGDTDTGKTVKGCSALAEACKLTSFNGYELIYAGCESDLGYHPSKMFGNRFRDRVTVLSSSNENKKSQPPRTVQEWHYQMMERFKNGRPFVYVLDSLDSLPSEEELEKVKDQYNAWLKNKETTGTMAMSKQKYMSQMFRDIRTEIEKTDSLLIVISQVRMKINAKYDPWTRSGGKALDFYARIISWMFPCYRQGWNNQDVIRGRVIGRWIKEEVSKNHITGKKRDIPFWIYDGYGIQDVQSSIYWLMLEKHWEKKGSGRLDVPEWNLNNQYPRDVVKYIQGNHYRERKLQEIVGEVWNSIEKDLTPAWNPKYL